MDPQLQVLLTEWHTGMDERGRESVRFGHRWYYVGATGLRAYTPYVEDLVPDKALTDAVGITHLRARFALGADNQLDIRVETEGKAGVVSERWRGGDLSRVLSGGRSGADYIESVARVSALVDADPVAIDSEDLSGKISALKRHRAYLMDCAEAGGLVDVDAISTKIDATRVELTAAVAEERVHLGLDASVEEVVP